MAVFQGYQASWGSHNLALRREDALSVGETDLTQTGELMRFTISANMAGIPAISVPVGHCRKGAPLFLYSSNYLNYLIFHFYSYLSLLCEL